MFHLLSELGLEALEWGDLVEATGNPALSILEVLRAGLEIAQAGVVLFTPRSKLGCAATYAPTAMPLMSGN